MPTTAHVDSFARDHLPPLEAQPTFLFELPELRFPERLNCATELLDRHVAEGRGDRRCVSAPGGPSRRQRLRRRRGVIDAPSPRLHTGLVSFCVRVRGLGLAPCRTAARWPSG